MKREADYSIKGFLYQFNKTLHEVLTEPELAEVTVEGIIEDIDIISSNTTRAIQCKYHETKTNYQLSDLSKPILQMLVHYSYNKEKNIQYVLYAHFSEEEYGERSLLTSDLEKIVSTKNKQYLANYVSTIKPPKDDEIISLISKEKKSTDDINKISEYYESTEDLSLAISLDDFNNPDRFKFIIGKSFDDLVSDVKKELKAKSALSEQDIEELFYPNAIQLIADKSMKHDPEERKIFTKSFISDLVKIKKTAVTRWTKEFKTYKTLLKRRRNQLKHNLQLNHRLRYIYFDADYIENFEDEIVNFVSNYISKYHFKIKLHSLTPLICINTNDANLISDIERRLYSKGIEIENGFKGNVFFSEVFLKEPKRVIKDNWFEFKLRLCELNEKTIKTINSKKCDDLFLVGRLEEGKIDYQDINLEFLEITNFNELKYLLSLQDSID